MASLQDWKRMLEKHGIECGIDEVSDGNHVLWAQLPGNDHTFYPKGNDVDNANFREAVTEHVFGPWAYYLPFAVRGEWGLVCNEAVTTVVGIGSTKDVALMDALDKTDAPVRSPDGP